MLGQTESGYKESLIQSLQYEISQVTAVLLQKKSELAAVESELQRTYTALQAYYVNIQDYQNVIWAAKEGAQFITEFLRGKSAVYDGLRRSLPVTPSNVVTPDYVGQLSAWYQQLLQDIEYINANDPEFWNEYDFIKYQVLKQGEYANSPEKLVFIQNEMSGISTDTIELRAQLSEQAADLRSEISRLTSVLDGLNREMAETESFSEIVPAIIPEIPEIIVEAESIINPDGIDPGDISIITKDYTFVPENGIIPVPDTEFIPAKKENTGILAAIAAGIMLLL